MRKMFGNFGLFFIRFWFFVHMFFKQLKSPVA